MGANPNQDQEREFYYARQSQDERNASHQPSGGGCLILLLGTLLTGLSVSAVMMCA